VQHALPGGENIQAWLAATRAGQHERAWRELVADNPFLVHAVVSDGGTGRRVIQPGAPRTSFSHRPTETDIRFRDVPAARTPARGDLRPYRTSPDQPRFYRGEFGVGHVISSWLEFSAGLGSAAITSGKTRQNIVLE
jgi:hypothetical protein